MPILTIPDSVFMVGALLAVFAIAYGFVLVPALPELADIAQKHGGGVYGAFNIAYNLGMAVGSLVGGVDANTIFPYRTGTSSIQKPDLHHTA